MRLSRVSGTFNIGVNAVANESLAFVTPDADGQFLRDLQEALGVETVTVTVGGAHVVGSLLAMNSNGIAVSGQVEGDELELIRKHLPVIRLPDELNAAGNNILVNDSGAIVNPDTSDRTLKQISKVFGVEAVRGTVAGINTVGSLCACNNKGCVCPTDATPEEIQMIKDVLRVDVQTSSVNHGSKYLGAGIVANTKGALIGDETTPIEMGRIEDGLALF
ncbi:putative translation initiation factor eIF-6 [Thermoplasmatales archaeon BRNA1]|nr:putative translation initiation factor eIF-6 [Thermoplasmatales archaeon BRNA1]